MKTSKAMLITLTMALMLGSAIGVAHSQDPISKFMPVEAVYCEERFSEQVPAESPALARLTENDSAVTVYKSCDSEALRVEEPQDWTYTLRVDTH